MKTYRLTLFDVDLRFTKFYKVKVDVSENHCEVIDYQLKSNGNRRSYKPELDDEDVNLIARRAKEKLSMIHGWGIL